MNTVDDALQVDIDDLGPVRRGITIREAPWASDAGIVEQAIDPLLALHPAAHRCDLAHVEHGHAARGAQLPDEIGCLVEPGAASVAEDRRGASPGELERQRPAKS